MHVTELVTFRLKAGVSEAEFLALAQATFDLLEQYEGYLGRELNVTEEGVWLDIVHWRDMPTALQVAEQFMQTSAGQAFGDRIDPDTMRMYHASPRLVLQKS